MKTSNIILLSLVGIIIVGIIIIQLQIKSAKTNIGEGKTIELQFDSFDKLNIASGWYVNIKQGEDCKIIITQDSLRNLIRVNDSVLYFSSFDNDEIKRLSADIVLRDINKINVSGNSIINYYAEIVDSLDVDLNENARFGIYYPENEDGDVDEEKSYNVIENLNVDISDHSRLTVRHDLGLLTGEMKDTTRFYFSGTINFKNFTTSKESHLSTW